MFKRWTLYLVLIMGLFACGAQAETTATPRFDTVSDRRTVNTPPSTPEPDSVILTVVPSVQPIATEKFVPKQNDLLFVEFFAVT